MKDTGTKALLVVSIIAALAIITAPASAAWPLQAEWITSIMSDWSFIDEPVSPGYSYQDAVPDQTHPTSTSSFWYFDGTYVYSRIMLNGNPINIDSNPDVLRNTYYWQTMIESTGNNYPDFMATISGVSNPDRVYTQYNTSTDVNMDGNTSWGQSQTIGHSTAMSEGINYTYLIDGYVRTARIPGSNYNGDYDYYLDIRFPLTWLARQGSNSPAPVLASSPIKFAYGTSTTANTIGIDLVGPGSNFNIPTFFASAEPIALDNVVYGGYGLLRDTRFVGATVGQGSWYTGENVSLSGFGWPVSTSTLFSSTLSVKILSPSSIEVWAGTVPCSTSGSVAATTTWSIGSSAEPGIYSVYVSNPRNTSEYILKDTFTVVTANLTTSIKSVAPTSGVASDQLTYSIVVTNTGNGTATGAVLTDAIPAHTSYVAGSSTLNGSPIPDDGGVCPFVEGFLISSLAPNASATFTFKVSINPSAPDQTVITNTAYILWNGMTIGKSAAALVNAPLMTITKSVNPTTSVLPGAVLTYSVTFTNIGHSNATAIEVLDSIPSHTTYVPGSHTSSAGGTFTFQHMPSGLFDASDALPVTAIKYSITPLLPGASVTFTFQATVK